MNEPFTKSPASTGGPHQRVATRRSGVYAHRLAETSRLSPRAWLLLVGTASLVALAATALCAVYNITVVVSHVLYLPIVLAAYRYLWRGVLYDFSLALVYTATVSVLATAKTEALLSAIERLPPFLGIATVIAALSASVHDAEAHTARQRDLAFTLESAHSPKQAARATAATLIKLREIDAVMVFLFEDDGGAHLIAHAGLSDAFVDRVRRLAPDSGGVTLLRRTETRWDVYARLTEEMGVANDIMVRRLEGLCGVGVLPIAHEGVALGSVVVASRSQYWLRATLQTTAELVTAQLARALLALRTTTLLYRQMAEVEALYEAARELNSTLDFDTMLARIAEQATRAVGADECHLWSYDIDDETQLCLAVHSHDPHDGRARPERGLRLPLRDHDVARRIITEGAIVELHADDPTCPDDERELLQRWGNRMALHVPLRIAGETVGRLTLTQYDDRHFDADELRLVQALGEHAAVAMENARLYSSAADQNRRLKALLASTQALTSTMAVDEVLHQTAQAAAEALGCPQCVLWEYDAENEALLYRASVNGTAAGNDLLARQRINLDKHGPYWQALHEQVAVVDYLSDPEPEILIRRLIPERGQKAALSVPIVYAQRKLGLLTAIETDRQRQFSDEDIEMAQALAEQAAAAITNATLYEAAEARATQDGLTGLHNHRHFYERLRHELARAKRYGEPLSLLMIDIDDFKHINDRHGHTVGDEVLRAIAQVLRTQVRRGIDVAARYGGEELALILPNTAALREEGDQPTPWTQRTAARADKTLGSDYAGPPSAAKAAPGLAAAAVAAVDQPPARAEGALAVAERVRAMIAASTYATDLVVGGVRVTVSIGVACRTAEDYLTPRNLVARADEALYEAKRRGKDCVVLSNASGD